MLLVSSISIEEDTKIRLTQISGAQRKKDKNKKINYVGEKRGLKIDG